MVFDICRGQKAVEASGTAGRPVSSGEDDSDNEEEEAMLRVRLAPTFSYIYQKLTPGGERGCGGRSTIM
jgi:hypothetical protein